MLKNFLQELNARIDAHTQVRDIIKETEDRTQALSKIIDLKEAAYQCAMNEELSEEDRRYHLLSFIAYDQLITDFCNRGDEIRLYEDIS